MYQLDQRETRASADILTGKRKMKAWKEITHYAGFDWGHNRHKVVIVDQAGQIVADLAIGHSAPGWQRWGEQVAALGGAVAACVETSQGADHRAALGKWSQPLSDCPAER